MTLRSVTSISLLTLGLTLTACVGGEEAPAPPAPPESAEPASSEVAVATTLEGLLRQIERGKDLEAARAGLDALLADPAVTTDQRVDIQLAQSRVLEALGDEEGAIAAVEALLSEHAADRRFTGRDAATKRLRKLLTGSEDEGKSLPRTEPVAPVAKVLTKYFPLDAESATEVSILTFGPDHGIGDQLGIYNVGAAHRELFEAKCPLCEGDVRVQTSKSSNGSWTGIPMTMKDHGDRFPVLDRAMVFFYFDLDAHRVPSRYDEYLPIPSEEITRELEKGHGVIAARERDGAPPLIVLAAPRMGQLKPVFEQFAQLSDLPKSPAFVELDPSLTSDEIRNVVRTATGRFRACYEALLAQNPEATGRVSIDFSIDGEGRVHGASANGGDTDLSDPTLESCLTDVIEAQVFPRSGKSRSTQVSYPLVMTPN